MVSGSEISFSSRGLRDLTLPHQVGVDKRTGAATIGVEVPLTPGRAGFQPELALNYSSTAPNSAYGLGWSLSGVSSVGLSLKDGLPSYDGTDVYTCAGAELVPWLEGAESTPRVLDGGEYWVHIFRSKVEDSFARLEKWVHKGTRRVHWRRRDRNNVVSVFGLDASGLTRIADPEHEDRTYEWLLEWQYDPHGNAIHFEYAAENADDVSATAGSEYHRLSRGNGFAQRYLRRLHYGNMRPLEPGDSDPGTDGWLFSVVLEYGERDGSSAPPYEEDASWAARPDPFSTYRPGFEVRTYRLCRRILMFHRFRELGAGATLVGALNIDHEADAAGSVLRSLRYVGYRRDPQTDAYTYKALPPLAFRYSEAVMGRAFVAAPDRTQANVPHGIGVLNHRWIDLHGDGLPGILVETDQAWYFNPNYGGGTLGPQRKVLNKPSGRTGDFAFSDFDGDGNLNLVVLQGREAGYFEYDRDAEKWAGFRPFGAAPHVKPLDSRTQLLDLNGDGRADIVTIDQDRITWFRSRGKEGFDPPVELAKPRSNGISRAPTIGPNPAMDYFFADMTGDGLPDQVRIQNGRIEYWPQLGHGRFGAGVLMDEAPVLDFESEFDAGRIRLVDLDGSGTADLLYIGRGEIRFWINASGNRFVEGGSVKGLPRIDNLASAHVLDFLGDGTACLVWSTTMPGHARASIQFLRLTEGVKPRLMVSVENSMGRETQVTYGHSARHFLRDVLEGRGWISKLPQHVTVVDRLTVIDRVGNTRFESLYEYHDGTFDGEERSFSGFGLVDQYDSDTYRGTSAIPQAEHADPVCVRTWFHNGVAGWEERRSRDYYRRDPQAASLPASFIEDLGSLGPGDFAQAFRTLSGSVVRTEVYGLRSDGRRTAHPYHITQSNYCIRRLQGRTEKADPCFALFESEALTYTYEQDPADPRIAHNLTIDIDDFGSVTRSCTVAYPRRATQRAGIGAQENLHISLSQIDVVNIDEVDRYRLAIPRENRLFEIEGLHPPEEGGIDGLFRLDDLAGEPAIALHPTRLIPFDEAFTGGSQARLVQWERLHYWNDARTDVLPWPGVGLLPLLHHTESACGTDRLCADVYGSRITPERARDLGLYHLHDGYWWQAGPTQHYLSADRFNLLARQVRGGHRDGRPVSAETSYAYDDPYLLNLTRVTDAIGSSVEAGRIDYHLPAPDRIVDLNENVSEVLYDALGIVIVATQYGRVLSSTDTAEDFGNEPIARYRPQPDAEFDRILDDPNRFLQGAGSYFYYDLTSWTLPNPQPLRSLALIRETCVHDGEGGGAPDSRIKIELAYVDGFGRNLQVKERAEEGPAVRLDAGGGVVPVRGADPRWRTSGHTVYDNKQQVVRQYEPFFSVTHAFQSDEALQAFGETTVTEYDPLGRAVRNLYPNDSRSRTVYAAWETVHFDPNDTVIGSLYEAVRAALPRTNPEAQALRKAQDHADTPVRVHLDPRGREVVVEEDGGDDGLRRTETVLDVAGNPVEMIDPRMLSAITYRRDMLGRVMSEHSVDAGEKWVLTDALDRPLHVWDGRGVHQQFEHDLLDRVVAVHVDGGPAPSGYAERMVYGDDPVVSQAALRNLRGQLARHYDQAGVVRFHRYDSAGRPLHFERRLAADYKREPNWSDAAVADPDALLEDGTYETQLHYDALGRTTWQHLADGSIRHVEYQRGGGVRQVRVSTADSDLREVPFLEDTAYDARGRRIGALLGNGVAVRSEYDSGTDRLARLYARQPADGDPDPIDAAAAPPERAPRRIYQDLRYTYDPAGNLVHLVDHAQSPPAGDVLSALRGEVHSTSTFRYDAFYQLREATGRFHEALQPHDYDGRRSGDALWIKSTRHLHLNNALAVRRYTRSFDYDVGGNLTRIDHVLDGEDTSRNWHTDFWISPSSNRSLLARDLHDAPISDPENLFDANGNCMYLPHLNRFAWNYRNQLARAVTVSRADDPVLPDDAEYYVHGGDGLRVRRVHERVVNGDRLEITEKIYLDGCEIKRIRRGGRVVLERTTSHVTDGSDRLALLHQWSVDNRGRETDDVGRKGIHYQLSNHLGSASLELDEHGDVISYEEYFPHGGTAFVAGRSDASGRLLRQEVSRKDYRYCGKERDDVTGLYDYGFRYYAPWLGRWLSPDPQGPVDGLNLYRFVHNNPVNLVDPDGLQSTEDEEIGQEWRENRGSFSETGDVVVRNGTIWIVHEHAQFGRVYEDIGPAGEQVNDEGEVVIDVWAEGSLLSESSFAALSSHALSSQRSDSPTATGDDHGGSDNEEFPTPDDHEAGRRTVAQSDDAGEPSDELNRSRTLTSDSDPQSTHSDESRSNRVSERRDGIELPAQSREPQEQTDLPEPIQAGVEFAAYMFWFAMGAAHAFLNGIVEMGLMAIDVVALTGLGLYYAATDDLVEWEPLSAYGQLWADRPGEAEDLIWRGFAETPDRMADAMIHGRPAELGAESVNALMMVEGGAGALQSATRLAGRSRMVASASTLSPSGSRRALATNSVSGSERAAVRGTAASSRSGARRGPPRGGIPPRRGGGGPPGGSRPPGGGGSSGGRPRGDRWSIDEVMKRFEDLEQIPEFDLDQMREIDAGPVRRPVFEGPATEALLDEFAAGAGPGEVVSPRHLRALNRLNILSGGRVEAYLKHLLDSIGAPVSGKTVVVFGSRIGLEELTRLIAWLKSRRGGG